PIKTAAQRSVLDAAKALAGSGSLIPKHNSYVAQMKRFEGQCKKAGIQQVHGLRHQYAQTLYEALAGWKCPAAGGPTAKELTPAQKARDTEVRLEISSDLGHCREQITAVYLGR
ncbi:MAG TPA: integrase, partial [Janthinobacterium sp.]|nr:integrase [Janthinobacterium sp.]